MSEIPMGAPGIPAAPTVPGGAGGQPGPADEILVAFAEPAGQRRLTVLVRIILAIPHLVVLYVLGIAAEVVALICWFAALVTGRLPDGLAEFQVGYLRWPTRFYAYLFLLTDVYPPFEFADADYPVRLRAEPGPLNRLAVLFRIILVIPAWIVSVVLGYGLSFLVMFVTWLIVLIAGRMPRPLHEALAAAVRYQTRVSGYFLMLTARYPGGLFGDPATPAFGWGRRAGIAAGPAGPAGPAGSAGPAAQGFAGGPGFPAGQESTEAPAARGTRRRGGTGWRGGTRWRGGCGGRWGVRRHGGAGGPWVGSARAGGARGRTARLGPVGPAGIRPARVRPARGQAARPGTAARRGMAQPAGYGQPAAGYGQPGGVRPACRPGPLARRGPALAARPVPPGQAAGHPVPGAGRDLARRLRGADRRDRRHLRQQHRHPGRGGDLGRGRVRHAQQHAFQLRLEGRGLPGQAQLRQQGGRADVPGVRHVRPGHERHVHAQRRVRGGGGPDAVGREPGQRGLRAPVAGHLAAQYQQVVASTGLEALLSRFDDDYQALGTTLGVR